MTTPKPLPADIEGLLDGIVTAVGSGNFTGRSDSYFVLREKLTALLSGYVEDAEEWRNYLRFKGLLSEDSE